MPLRSAYSENSRDDECTSLLRPARNQKQLQYRVRSWLRSLGGGDAGNNTSDDAIISKQNEPHQESIEPVEPKSFSKLSFLVLLAGVFLASGDAVMVISTYANIASQLGELQNAVYILTAYHVGTCAAQPLYGKLSDIFGRRSMLLAAYAIFAFGTVFSGLGRNVLQVAVSRAIKGIGGAGMVALVSIIVVDLVPLDRVAQWRSYVYVAATIGRASGVPLGGLLNDTIGWRWSFIGQVPLILVAFILVRWQLPPMWTAPNDKSDAPGPNFRSKLKRIDFLGSILLGGSISVFLLALNFASKELTFDPLLGGVIGIWLVLTIAFWIVELFWAREPIFPIQLMLKRSVISSYLIQGLQSGAQVGMLSTIAPYFTLSARASKTIAAVHLLPAFVGVTAGALFSGQIIKRTGHYKNLIVAACLSSCLGFGLLLLRWHGHTNVWESLYIVFSGFGTGTSTSAVFLALNASIAKEQSAVASTGFYLAMGLGEVFFMSVSTAGLQATVRQVLEKQFEGLDDGAEVIRRVTASIDNIWKYPPHISKVVVDTYLQGLRHTYMISLGASILAFLIALSIKEYSLKLRR